jgi:2-polyprenyl-6-methoxyphenol hydroxylase-like FAD-dependent oxidoreductase
VDLRVIVIGAGIGGLALAHGLRRADIDVAVYERDRTPSHRLQGYRVHIDAAGSRALHACLPPELFDAFVATCGQPNRGIAFYSHRLRELIRSEATRLPAPTLSASPGPPAGLRSAKCCSQDSATWCTSAIPSAGTGSAPTVASTPTSTTAALRPVTSMLVTPIRTSVPVGPWPATTVTLLGDAIHSMPPTGGVGANTALRDAALLSHTLAAAAAAGDTPLLRAVADYEAEMRRYGFQAVHDSLRNPRRQQRTENPLALAATKATLRVLSALRANKRPARQRTPQRLSTRTPAHPMTGA